MGHRFSSREDKWTKVLALMDDRKERQSVARMEQMLEELATAGFLKTSIDDATGETLYRYDDTDPRARMLMSAALAG